MDSWVVERLEVEPESPVLPDGAAGMLQVDAKESLAQVDRDSVDGRAEGVEPQLGYARTLQCSDDWARQIEMGLRRTLYQWKHIPGDMIVDDCVSCPKVIHIL